MVFERRFIGHYWHSMLLTALRLPHTTTISERFLVLLLLAALAGLRILTSKGAKAPSCRRDLK